MVEDYTTPFLVSTFVLVFMALLAIWAVWGLIAALVLGWLADIAMIRISRHRG